MCVSWNSWWRCSIARTSKICLDWHQKSDFELNSNIHLRHSCNQNMQNIVTWGQNMSANIEEFTCISMGGLFSGVPPSNRALCLILRSLSKRVKGGGMGPWLVLVSPCFRENVVATCKIGSFLCSLDNLLQKNVSVLFFGNQISKWRSFEKRAIFDLLFTFFKHQGKVIKNSFSTYLTHIYTRILLTLLTFFCLTNFEKNMNLSGTVSLWYESRCWFLFAPFWNNQ